MGCRLIRKEDYKGEPVQYAGYYVLHINNRTMPEPEVFFVEDESDEEKTSESIKKLREQKYDERMNEIDEEISQLAKKKYDSKSPDFLRYVNLLGQKVGMIWMKHLDSRIQFKIIDALMLESNERVM